MTKNQQAVYLAFYGVLLSTIIGSISFIFIFLESNLTSHLWNNLFGNPLAIVGATLLGAFLIGFLKIKWGKYPEVAHHTISELKTNHTVPYTPVFKNLTVALFVLVFGAGVGPEAALLSSLVMLSVWQSDKLRYLFFNQEKFLTLKKTEQLKRMTHPTKYLKTYKEEHAPIHPKWKQLKTIINTLFVFNGLFAFTMLMKLTEQPSFISKMGISNWQLKELILFIPLFVIGILVGKAFILLRKQMKKWFNFWQDAPIKKALLGAIAISLMAIFLPSLLFSGQTSLGAVPESYLHYSVFFLLFLVLLKLVFLEICLNTGWVGGDIFPIVFASILFGFALSQVFSGFDALFVTSVLATAMASTIIGSPIGVAVFVALFFPMNILPIIILVAIFLTLIKKVIEKRKLVL